MLTIPLPLTTLNEHLEISFHSGYKGHSNKKREMNKIGRQIKKQLPNLRINGKVFMVYKWFCENRRYDRDNITFARKVIQDTLVTHRIIENDGWNDIDMFFDLWSIDRDNPRVEVEIYPCQLWEWELVVRQKEQEE